MKFWVGLFLKFLFLFLSLFGKGSAEQTHHEHTPEAVGSCWFGALLKGLTFGFVILVYRYKGLKLTIHILTIHK